MQSNYIGQIFMYRHMKYNDCYFDDLTVQRSKLRNKFWYFQKKNIRSEVNLSGNFFRICSIGEPLTCICRSEMSTPKVGEVDHLT